VHAMSLRSARLLAAFLVTPLVPPVLAFLISNSRDGVWVAKFALPFSIVTTLVVALPLHILFSKLEWASVWAYMLIGACCGLVAVVFIFAGTVMNAFAAHVPGPWASIAVLSIVFGVLGSLSGLVFWLVARPDRP